MADENMIEFYQKKFTRKELLTRVYNRIMERLIEFEIDAEFYPLKAKRYKHNSPEAIAALQEGLQRKDWIENNKLTLRVIEDLLRKEK